MDSTRVTIGFGEMLRQSHMTAHDYLIHAISDIDEALGDGYAAKHPDLIAAYMKVAAMDYATSCQSLAAQQERDLKELERMNND